MHSVIGKNSDRQTPAAPPRFRFGEEVLARFQDGDRFVRVVSIEADWNLTPPTWVYGLKADGPGGDPFAFWGLRYFPEAKIQTIAESVKD